MKSHKFKSKILKGIIATIGVAAPVANLVNMVSCSCSQDAIVKEIMEQTVKEFFEICNYPRPSGNLDKIRPYLLGQAFPYAIDTIGEDKVGNIWWDLPATSKKYEKYPKLILQGHMDMVYAGPEELKFEPIIPEYHEDGNYIITKDRKTSLGSDDGIGLGLMLAIMKNKHIEHGPLRILCTVDEETTMAGAKGIGEEVLDTDYYISVDGEIKNGGLYVSSSGGVGYQLHYDYNDVPVPATNDGKNTFTIVVDGLKGGHSGNEIGLGRANAERFIFEGLNNINTSQTRQNASLDIRLIDFNHKQYDPVKKAWGGENQFEYTSLISNAVCTFQTSLDQEKVKEFFDNLKQDYLSRYPNEDPDSFKFYLLPPAEPSPEAYCFSEDESNKLIKLIGHDLKYGVILPEQTDYPIEHPNYSANIGPTLIENGVFDFQKYDRADSDANIETLKSNVKVAFAQAGFNEISEDEFNEGNNGWYIDSEEPCWQKRPDDKIVKLCKKGYEANGIEWYERQTNGAVEPAVILSKKPTIQITCLGAEIVSPHNPNETCYLDTLESSLKSLIYVFKHINELG